MSESALFYHTKRPQWGLCMIAGRTNSGVRYQFEDGKLRTIAPSFAERYMLEAVPREDTQVRFGDLAQKLEANTAVAPQKGAAPRPTLRGQVELFKAELPGGFEDPQWLESVRGAAAKRARKSHRDPVIQRAQQQLKMERMKALIEQGQTQTLWTGLIEVLKSTDLVNVSKEVRPLEAVGASARLELCHRLFELLHGEGRIEVRLDRYVTALRDAGVKPSWPLVTAPMALLAPQTHLYVRPAVIRRQAKVLSPKLKITPDPLGKSYVEMLQMMESAKRDLERQGMRPRDLLDVYAFTQRTTKRRAKSEELQQAA